MNASQVAQILEKYSVVALRACHNMFEPMAVEIGEILDPSFVWIDGEPTDEALNGTCGCQVNASNFKEMYSRFVKEYGSIGTVALIAGHHYEYGQDNDEVIIRDAVVVGVA